MPKSALQFNPPHTKSIQLFGQSGSDQFYKDVKSEIAAWHVTAKNHWQQLYDEHRDFLDKDYADQFPLDTFSRLWELTIIDFIAQHKRNGVNLIKLTGKASKPDFCFELNGNRFFLEAVCASPGIRPELMVDLASVSGIARRTPTIEHKESLCSEIKLKGNIKYHGAEKPGYKAYMGDDAGLIIAVSMAKIPFYNQANNIYEDLSCLFAMSPMKIPLERGINGKLEMGKPYFNHQPVFSKSHAGALIDTCYFSDDQYSHISAILISHYGHSFFPGIDQFDERCNWKTYRNDFKLIHNPFAKVPLPKGLLKATNEITATVKDNGELEINFNK